MKKTRKGIILAGGIGSRLHPLTQVISKQLLPVFDKPMIYYPLSTLMLAGIKEIAIISTPLDLPKFKKLLGSGKQWGLKLTYLEQKKPNGIAEAFILAEKFIKDSPCCLILGDNIYHGNNFSKILKEADNDDENSTVFTYQVKDPERFGILNLDKKGRPAKIIEKPKSPKSNLAITGLYFFPKGVSSKAKKLKPSKRGELEISDLNQSYIKDKKLKVKILNRGFTWLDTGTFDSLLEASNFISLVQNRQNTIVACPEEIAFLNKWINKSDIKKAIKDMQSTYSEYLKNLIK
ncbi:MAG: glucose-1-phosphate thymidylyltransferase RfbA [Gammaproteobacteria bacterium]